MNTNMNAAGQPALTTERLLLRPFTLADAPEVRRLAGDRNIAETTLNIPHPYEDGMAEEWISSHPEQYTKGEGVVFAITLQSDDMLVGAVGLAINQRFDRAELGYWIGSPYWNQGYCTEASREVLRYAFQELELNRVQATHLTRNSASGRVMQKLGMKREGRLRQYVKKWDIYEDLEMYSILKDEVRG
ncbi:MAG: GNAT family N-acetyltransferase [Chloroflexota bacterium]|nr:GNAT family N-acetyltransferase [Chloroflexota bacterium]